MNQTGRASCLIDLHTHSTCSDGSMTPAALVRHAKAAGLSAVAVSDHDTADGTAEAVRTGREVGIEVIPAIELSAQSDTETHILGYFIDPDSPVLREAVGCIRAVRTERIGETCVKLREHGVDVTLGEVKAVAGGGILCRAHVARIMTEKGFCPSPKEAFRVWLNVGCPAYSDAQALTDAEAISLIRDAGGAAYLAHLHLTKKTPDELDAFVARLAREGLAGLEGYYTDYTPQWEEQVRSLAEKYGLKRSGGTDFHGSFKPHIGIGCGGGRLAVPYAVLDAMRR